MKILNSAIDFQGGYKLEQKKNVLESLKTWVDGQSTEAEFSGESPAAVLKLSDGLLTRLQEQADKTAESSESGEAIYELSPKDKELIELLERFLSRLTGKEYRIKVPARLTLTDSNLKSVNQRQGWGLDYHYEETYSEKETMVFTAQGKILSEGGKEIEVALNLEVSREYCTQQTLDIKAGDALIDPLVINFGTGSAKLSGEKVTLDLNSDGVEDNISLLEEGSGFLAIDKNEDGKINDGSELFGPDTGDGFGELAEYDIDANGWIDENDPVFDKISIWVKDFAGNDMLLALAQKGVGAICLRNAETVFSLKDNSNNLNGQIMETGIFIREDGQAGTIQHIDLVV